MPVLSSTPWHGMFEFGDGEHRYDRRQIYDFTDIHD